MPLRIDGFFVSDTQDGTACIGYPTLVRTGGWNAMASSEKYCLVGKRTDTGITLLSEKLADGNRALLVFG